MQNFKIIKEKENSLFKRKEIQASVDADSTPSHLEVLNFISEKFSCPKENIKIKGILGGFGTQTFKLIINIYKSKQDKDAVELKKKREIENEKKELEESKKENIEESKEETKPEETKEEIVEETKSEEVQEDKKE